MKKTLILILLSIISLSSSAATYILGTMQADVDRMYYFVRSRNSSFPREIAENFYNVAKKYGMRGDIALCQSCVETGWFKYTGGTAVRPEHHNYCGLGVTEFGKPGCIFSTVKEGVTAQIQHLFAYATTKALPAGEVLVDPRFKFVTRGSAPTWESLSGKWAAATNYGTQILSIYREMMNYTLPVSLKADKTSASLTGTQGWAKPSVNIQISATGLSSDINVNSSTSTFEVTKVNWNNRTGGTLKISLNTSKSPGNYSGYVKVQSGSYSATINLTGTIKVPPLSLSEGWEASQAKGNQNRFGWDATKVRNFSYMNGKLYCVYDHSEIKVINAQTGADLGNLNKSGVGGGTLTFCDVKTIDGHIVACNLATAANGHKLTLYAWDKDNGSPYILFQTTDYQGATRLGDCMELSGSWSNLCVTFANDNGSQTKIIEFHRNSSGTWITKSFNATTDGYTRLSTSATTRAYSQANGWWIDGKDCHPTWLTNSNGVAKKSYSINIGETWGASHHEFYWKGIKYAMNLVFSDRVAGDASSTYKNGRMRLTIDNSSNYSNITNAGEYPKGGLGSTRNTNCTGDCMVTTDGSSYVEAWVCSTTQGMAYYKYGSVPSHNPQPIKPAGPEIKASTSSVSLSSEIWSSTTSNVTISGANLSSDIRLELSGSDANYFELSTNAISKNSSASVTIKYSPIYTGTHYATLTATSAGATPVSIYLTGNASPKMELDDNVTKMAEVWNYSGNTSVPSWMSLTDPTVRSIAFLNGKLYVLHGNPYKEPVVKIIDAYNGSYKGDLNLDGLTSAMFKISSIISFDGKLFASSLSDVNNTLTIYRWDSDTSKPVAVVSDANHGGVKCGATLSASGNLQNGRFWINNENTDRVMYYTITNGSVSSTPQTIMLKNANGTAFAGGDGRGSAEVVANSDGSFWLAAKDVVPTLFNSSGVAQKSMNISALNGNFYGTAMKIFNFGKRKYVAATTYKSVNTNGGFVLIDVTDGIETAEKSNFFYPEKGLGPAGNDQRVTSICQTTRNSGSILDIWVCVKGQGVAHYTYTGGKVSSVDELSEEDGALIYNGETVSIASGNAEQIVVYATSGAMVANAIGKNEVSTSELANGVYIVRAATTNGKILTSKIIKK